MRTLATEKIGKSYGGREVVRGVDIHIQQGEVVGLLGPNGAGKTTTFYMTVGLVRPDFGRVLCDGKDITRTPMYLRARNFGISYLPQEPSVFRKLTAEENILAVLEAQPDISMPELAAKLAAETKVAAHPASLSRALLGAGFRYKKSPSGIGVRTR